MRRATKSRVTWTGSEEEEGQEVQEAHNPDAFPHRGLRKALSQPNGRRRPNPGGDGNTFPALLTVWAAGTLLLKKRGSGHNAGTSGRASDGLTVNLEADVLSKIAELDAQVKALQSQQQQQQQQHGEEKQLAGGQRQRQQHAEEKQEKHHQQQQQQEQLHAQILALVQQQEQHQHQLLQQDAKLQTLEQQQEAELSALAGQQEDAKLAALGQQHAALSALEVQQAARLAALGEQHDKKLSDLEQQQESKLAALGQQHDTKLSALEQQQTRQQLTHEQQARQQTQNLQELSAQLAAQQQQWEAELHQVQQQQTGERQHLQQQLEQQQAQHAQHAQLSGAQLSALEQQQTRQQLALEQQARQQTQNLQQLSAQLTAQQQACQEQVDQHTLLLRQLSAQLATQQQQWEAELHHVQQQEAGERQHLQQQLEQQQAQRAQQAEELFKVQQLLEEQQTQYAQQLEQQQAQHAQELEEQKAQLKQLVEQMNGMGHAEHQQRGAMIPGGDPRGQLDLMAVRTMVALGIDLTKPKYRPGLETAVSTLKQLGSGPVPGSDLRRSGGYDSPHSSTPTKRGAFPFKPQVNPVSKKHQPGLVAATTILSSLAMLLGEAGNKCADNQPGVEAGSHALAALCSDTLSTAKDTDFHVHVQALSRAAAAVAEKGVEPYDPVHKPGMLAAASILAALGGLKPSPEQQQQQQQQQQEGVGEEDALFFSDQAATVDALIELTTHPTEQQQKKDPSGAGDQQTVSAREMLANRLVSNVGGAFKPPKPDALAGDHQTDTNGNTVDDATLQELDHQHAELSKRVSDMEAGLKVVLMALKIDKENAVHDPEAAAAAANLCANGMLFKELSKKLKELSEQQDKKHEHTKVVTSSQLTGLERQVEELQGKLSQDASSTQLASLQMQIDVALDALGIDKSEVLEDPETAALGATTNTNMAQLRELSRKVDHLHLLTGPTLSSPSKGQGVGGCKDAAAVKESLLTQLGTRLDSLERKSAMSAVDPSSAVKGMRPADLKALESHLLDRLEEQAKSTEQLGRVIEVIVADANKLASLHGLRTLPQQPEATTYYLPPFTFTSVFQKYMTYDDILEKFAQNKNMKEVAAKARSDVEGCLTAMKEIETKSDTKDEVFNQVLIKIAGQVDFLHNKIKDVAAGRTPDHSSTPPLARTSSGRPSLTSMGTLGRSTTLRRMLGLADEKVESSTQRALQEPELQRKDSGASSSSITTKKSLSERLPSNFPEVLARYKANQASKKARDSEGSSGRSIR